jgi:hypothetical protein
MFKIPVEVYIDFDPPEKGNLLVGRDGSWGSTDLSLEAIKVIKDLLGGSEVGLLDIEPDHRVYFVSNAMECGWHYTPKKDCGGGDNG